MTTAYWFALWAAVGTSTAFAMVIVVLSDKLQDARHELIEWRKYAARVAVDEAKDAVAQAEWLR